MFQPEGEIRESADGQTWRLWPQGLVVYHDIVFADGYFTAVGEGLGSQLIEYHMLWRAPGVVEQGGPKTFSGGTRGIAFGDGMFVSVGGIRAVPNPWWIGRRGFMSMPHPTLRPGRIWSPPPMGPEPS